MRSRRHWSTWALVAAVVVLAVLAYAWSNGGREPLREISEPVTVSPTPSAEGTQ